MNSLINFVKYKEIEEILLKNGINNFIKASEFFDKKTNIQKLFKINNSWIVDKNYLKQIYNKNLNFDKIKLYPYQLDVVKYIENKERMTDHSGGILAMDMGTGKSFCSISLIYRNVLYIPQTLVIVPKSLLLQWKNECNRFLKYRNNLNINIFYGKNKKYSKDDNIIITTYETIRLASYNNKIITTLYDRIILDESHTIRNCYSSISKGIYRLRSKRKWCLTGTPFFNTPYDLHGQSQFIGIEPYCNRQYWRNIMKNSDKIENWLSNYCYILKKEDVITLPDIHFNDITVEFSNIENSLYQTVLKNFTSHNDNRNILSTILKLRQISDCKSLLKSKNIKNCILCNTFSNITFPCNHSLCDICYNQVFSKIEKYDIKNEQKTCKIYNTLKSITYDDIASIICDYLTNLKPCPLCSFQENSKINKVKELLNKIKTIESVKDDKVIIFTQWKSMIPLVKSILNDFSFYIIDGTISSFERNNILRKFKNNSKFSILLCTIQTCGVGLDLTCANHVIILDDWWNPFLEKQAIDRVYRLNQTKEVNVYRLHIKNSIEQWVQFIKIRKIHYSNFLLSKTHTNNDYKIIQSLPKSLDKNKLYATLGYFEEHVNTQEANIIQRNVKKYLKKKSLK